MPRTIVIIFLTLLWAAALSPGTALSASSDITLAQSEYDDIMDGFDDDPVADDILEGFEDEEPVDITIENIKPSPFSIDGFFKIGSSYNFAHDKPDPGQTDWRGLSRLQAELQIDLKAKFFETWQAQVSGKCFYDAAYKIQDRDEFTDDVLDNYEREYEMGEVFILGSPLNNLDIKVGRQIIVWGKSDNIRVTDVLNPLDNREPGLTDIEDLRLPVTMTRLDYYVGNWSVTGIAVHEIRFNKNPEYGHDFYPYPYPPPHEDEPSNGGSNTEYAVAINGIFTGWDLAFYWAHYYDDTPHLELNSLEMALVVPFPPEYETTVETELKHAELDMVGSAFNIALGNWLIKAEAAYINGIKFFNFPARDELEMSMTGATIQANPGKKYSRIDVLAGAEYLGFSETSISVEVLKQHINHYDDRLATFLYEYDDIIAMFPDEFGSIAVQAPDEADENEYQTALRITKNYLNDTLELTCLFYLFGRTVDAGSLERFSAEYDINDDIKISGGIALYQSGTNAEYTNIHDNDRLFFDIRYSF